MTTITKEWLQQTIAEFENTRDDIPFGLDDDDAKILIVLKRALASLTAEPVRYLNKFSGTCVTLEQQPNASDDVAVYMPLYAAPPASEREQVRREHAEWSD
ncbi:dATP/dGTP pyrophosphohydrolase domain-containing protein, partial [Salmonella enterica subsp. enterica serovar Chester]